MQLRALRKFKNFIVQFWFAITLILITAGFLTFLIVKNSTKGKIDPAVFQNHDFQKFNKFAKENGAELSYQILKKQFPNNEPAAHDFAHVVGLVAYEQKGPQGLSICDTSYNYGCSHGFIEGFIIKKGVEALGEIETSCISLGQIHAPSCLHGIGHGLMINSSYNIDPALKDCDRLQESSKIYCWDGAFMEKVIGSMRAQTDQPKVTAQNLDEPCKSIAKIYQNQCYRNQVTVWLSFFNNDSKKVIDHCNEQEKEFQQTCTESIGLVNTMNFQDNTGRLIDSCSNSKGKLTDECLMGEMKELLFEGKFPQIAQSLCGYVSDKNSQECTNQFNLHYSQYQQRFSKT